MSRALIIVDVQRDFEPGGALAVPGGDEVVAPISALARDGGFDVVIATRDWHPPDHSSFVAQGGPWPVHCVQDTPGAQLDPALPLDAIDVIADTGTEVDDAGYSGFESAVLRDALAEHDVDAVTIAGLATDVCVAATARDAVDAGLAVTVVRGACRGIDAADSERALAELAAAGATIAD